MPDRDVAALERAARHWRAPDTEPLGEWQLRAAAGFTGRANSALPHGAGPAELENHLAERRWLPRPGPALVMLADIAALPASPGGVEFAPEPDGAFLGLYRYRGQDLPPIARTLLMSAPWQAFGRIRRDGPGARSGSCSRSRRATPRPVRCTSGVASPVRIVTAT